MLDRSKLRAQIRTSRKQISLEEQSLFASQASALIVQSPLLGSFQHFGLYIAADGEMDPASLVQKIWQLKKESYLPVMVEEKESRLIFRYYDKKTTLTPNHFGIPEPHSSPEIALEQLDVVFTPLVAFDLQGNRLGMGGGCYDRTFQYLKKWPEKKPLLIGLAYELQKLDKIEANEWDVPLQGVFTEKQFYDFSRKIKDS